MQKFKYTAVDVNKKKFKGSFLAENIDDLRMQLAKQRLYLVRAESVSEKPPNSFFSLTGKVKMKELTTFCRQFAIMINSGVSIIESLNILKEQRYSGFFRKVLAQVHEDVESGLFLSEAMKKHKKVFPDMFTSMTYVGEKSGMLSEVLCSVADYYENDAKIKRKAKSALIYPCMLFVMMIALVTVMLAFVIPKFEDSLAKLDVPMPPLTTAILDISHWFQVNILYVALGIAFVALIIFILMKTEKGKYAYDTLLLKLPVVKKVQISLISARFARGFSLLLSSGMDIIESMKAISAVLGNKNVEKRFKLAAHDVSEGQTLTNALEKYKLFPTMLIQMVSVGEKTGGVSKVLSSSCSYFDEQAESSLNAMTQFIQPVMLIMIGGTVGILFYAIYSPMLSIMTTL